MTLRRGPGILVLVLAGAVAACASPAGNPPAESPTPVATPTPIATVAPVHCFPNQTPTASPTPSPPRADLLVRLDVCADVCIDPRRVEYLADGSIHPPGRRRRGRSWNVASRRRGSRGWRRASPRTRTSWRATCRSPAVPEPGKEPPRATARSPTRSSPRRRPAAGPRSGPSPPDRWTRATRCRMRGSIDSPPWATRCSTPRRRGGRRVGRPRVDGVPAAKTASSCTVGVAPFSSPDVGATGWPFGDDPRTFGQPSPRRCPWPVARCAVLGAAADAGGGAPAGGAGTAGRGGSLASGDDGGPSAAWS